MGQNYTVTAQQQIKVPDAQGRLVDAIEISFEVPGVGPFSEVVPIALYTTEYVSDLLERTAGQVLAIQDL